MLSTVIVELLQDSIRMLAQSLRHSNHYYLETLFSRDATIPSNPNGKRGRLCKQLVKRIPPSGATLGQSSPPFPVNHYFDWPLSKPKCNKWLHKTNRLSSGKTTIHQSLSHFLIPSSQSNTYWTLHLLFLHTIDCPHQEVTTVPSSKKIKFNKTTEFRHVYTRHSNSGHGYMHYREHAGQSS